MYIDKVIFCLKFIFHISVLLLIILSLYPGSLIGFVLYDDLLVFSLLPIFLMHLKKDLYLIFYFLFLFIYSIINLLFNLNPNGMIGDLQWFIKPLVLI